MNQLIKTNQWKNRELYLLYNVNIYNKQGVQLSSSSQFPPSLRKVIIKGTKKNIAEYFVKFRLNVGLDGLGWGLEVDKIKRFIEEKKETIVVITRDNKEYTINIKYYVFREAVINYIENKRKEIIFMAKRTTLSTHDIRYGKKEIKRIVYSRYGKPVMKLTITKETIKTINNLRGQLPESIGYNHLTTHLKDNFSVKLGDGVYNIILNEEEEDTEKLDKLLNFLRKEFEDISTNKEQKSFNKYIDDWSKEVINKYWCK